MTYDTLFLEYVCCCGAWTAHRSGTTGTGLIVIACFESVMRHATRDELWTPSPYYKDDTDSV
jgi:hypothetical protein